MTKYRIIFIYGSWHLWIDIERYRIQPDDRRGFADLAQLAVREALNSIPEKERVYVAHDYMILEIKESPTEEKTVKMVYSFDTLANE